MIGTVSTDEKAELAKANGCAHTIVTSRENIVERVKEITGGKGVPVVYDSVGKDTLEASLNSLQPRGSLVSNGTSSGPVVIDTAHAGRQGLALGHAAGDGALHQPRAHMLDDGAASCSTTCWPGASSSEPKQIFPLADAAEAHRALESRKTTGVDRPGALIRQPENIYP